MLDAKLNPCAQELQFDLYDYDPRGMEGQPTTVSSIYLLSQCQFDPKSQSLVIGWQTFFTISLVELMLLFSVWLWRASPYWPPLGRLLPFWLCPNQTIPWRRTVAGECQMSKSWCDFGPKVKTGSKGSLGWKQLAALSVSSLSKALVNPLIKECAWHEHFKLRCVAIYSNSTPQFQPENEDAIKK